MYDFPVNTPANTTKAAPLRTELRLQSGVITLVHVAFPPGPQGHLHLTVERAGSLIWPVNEGEGFAWDDYTLIFNPFLELSVGDDVLHAVSWNGDDSFPHQVNIRIQVTPRELVFPDRAEIGLLQTISARLFGSRR